MTQLAGLSTAKAREGRPFLRWAGSKRSMLPTLRAFMPSTYGKYIEPFAGSACLFFSTSPQYAVLGDLNQDLIAMYQSVARDPDGVASRLAALPTGSDAYYSVRSGYLSERDELARAAIFIYLNRFCFNGLYRTNLKGEFNVPYGAPRSAAVPSAVELTAAAALLKGKSLVCGDFEQVVRGAVQPGDFVYLDPPFHASEKRIFRQYTATPFTMCDFDRLTKLLGDLDAMGVKFLVSYAHSEGAEAAFQKYNICTVATRRNISGFPQHRAAVLELIVSNYAAQD